MLIRLVGVRFSHLVGGSQQLNMFEDTPEMAGLYQAMDYLRKRFGTHAVRKAGGMDQDDNTGRKKRQALPGLT